MPPLQRAAVLAPGPVGTIPELRQLRLVLGRAAGEVQADLGGHGHQGAASDTAHLSRSETVNIVELIVLLVVVGWIAVVVVSMMVGRAR